MLIRTAGTALESAMSTAGFVVDSPSLDRALDALSIFAREQVDDVPKAPFCDQLLCEAALIGRDETPTWSFSLRRQVIADDDSGEMFQFGISFSLEETPELLAFGPKNGEPDATLFELWRETSDLGSWLDSIRSTPIYRALSKSRIERTTILRSDL